MSLLLHAGIYSLSAVTGAVIPKTCLPSSTELTAGMRTACQAIKVQDAEECADIWKILNQNSLEAFGPVAAESLGADYQVLAASGTGCQLPL